MNEQIVTPGMYPQRRTAEKSEKSRRGTTMPDWYLCGQRR